MNTRFLELVKDAPEGFYSPCGRVTPLTVSEIETRAINSMVPNVTYKEMVVRKFAEVLNFFDVSNQFFALRMSYDFLNEQGLHEEEVNEITYELEKELVSLRHNPRKMFCP